MLVFLMVRGGDGEFAGHAKVDFEMKIGGKSEEHSFAVSS